METPHRIAKAESHFIITLQLDISVGFDTGEDSRDTDSSPGVSGSPNDLSTVRPV